MYSLRAQNKAQKWHLLTKILSLVVMVSSLPASAAKSPINNDILNELATSGALKTSNSRVIIDNDEAFRKKISNIKSAQSGDEIDMIYYIYANDFSSSVMSYELIQAAQRGVKVRLLVDYLTNFKNIDTLLMLEQKGTTASGAKNIEVRLFGKPSKKIIADAVFLTTSCDTGMDGCIDRKREKAALLQDGGDGTDYMSRLFLAGLFAKNAGALKIAVIEGQEIDPSQFKSDEPMSAEDLKDLKKLGRLIFKAKVKGEMMAKLQLFFAMIAYEDEVMPIYNLVTTSLPISSDDDSAREWTYLTDYTHHKIMLVTRKNGGEIILGGRNIEDSYHVKVNDMTTDAKYIFMDTEYAADLDRSGTQQIQKRFNTLWGFNDRVATLPEADQRSEIDSLASLQSVVETVALCKSQSKNLTSKCMDQNIDVIISKNGADRKTRLNQQYQLLLKNRETYLTEHAVEVEMVDTWSGQRGRDALSASDVQNAEVYYIENLPFAKKFFSSAEDTRQYGADIFKPEKSNKNITALMLRGLEQTCQTATKANPKRVILHNAYFFPSPAVVRAFGNMINGKWSCENVKLTFITNSYETTDLFPVNGMASMQVKALFDASQTLKKTNAKARERMAQIEFFEYKKSSESDSRSLHTKIAIMGDDVILGSANLDIRSYAMDTNNGVYIRGAQDFAKSYTEYIDRLLNNKVLNTDGSVRFVTVNRTSELLSGQNVDQYRDQNIEIFKYVSAQYKSAQRVFANADFISWLSTTMDFIYASTLSSLDVNLTVPTDRNLKLWGPSCESRKSQKAMCERERLKDQKLRRLKWEDTLQSLFQSI